jgi:hypothetical protein
LSGLANEIRRRLHLSRHGTRHEKIRRFSLVDIDPALRDFRWLFFDMGYTLISEQASTTYRIERICRCLQPA